MQLRDIDTEDIEEVLPLVEDSFGFRFSELELMCVRTFGELCDLVIEKLKDLRESNDCTSQQAFYQLRDSIALVMGVDKQSISPRTDLKGLIPAASRRKTIRKIEAQLGFRIKILRPSHVVTAIISIIGLTSFVGLFFAWPIAIFGILITMVGVKLADDFANTFGVITVGEAAEKMSRENYLVSRRDPKTINRHEIENKIRELYAEKLDLPTSELTRDALLP